MTLPGIRSASVWSDAHRVLGLFDEIAVTFLLTGRDNTLPMTLWSLLRREVTPEVNAVATFIVLISIILIVCRNVFFTRARTNEREVTECTLKKSAKS